MITGTTTTGTTFPSNVRLAWQFILSITIFDTLFAVAFQDTFPRWEGNPIQLAVFQHYGIEAVVAFRILTVILLIGLLAKARCKVIYWATSVVFAAHVLLLLIYVYSGVVYWDLV